MWLPSRDREGTPDKQESSSAPKEELSWGYDASGHLGLDEFIRKTTTTNEADTPEDGIMHNVAIYFDRGTTKGGDECMMTSIGLETKKHFAHVVDIQTWFKSNYWTPKPKHNLGEAAGLVGVKMTSQWELQYQLKDERANNSLPVRHCAGCDGNVALLLFLALLTGRMLQLSALEGRTLKFKKSYRFVGIDFEFAGRHNEIITEAGVAQILSSSLIKDMEDYAQHIETRHAIILEQFDRHPNLGARIRMGINHEDEDNYPRNNFHSGPNGNAKREFWFKGKFHSISKNTAIVRKSKLKLWMTAQLCNKSAATINVIARSESSLAPTYTAKPASDTVNKSNNAIYTANQHMNTALINHNTALEQNSSSSDNSTSPSATPVPGFDDTANPVNMIRSGTSSDTSSNSMPPSGSTTCSTGGSQGIAPEASQVKKSVQPAAVSKSGYTVASQPSVIIAPDKPSVAVDKQASATDLSATAEVPLKASRSIPPHIKYAAPHAKAVPPHRRVYPSAVAEEGVHGNIKKFNN